jgi:hypothetical protein
MTSYEHLQRKLDELKEHYHLLSEQISALRKAVAIEVDIPRKFQVQKQIEQLEHEREEVAKQIEALEEQMNAANLLKKATHRFEASEGQTDVVDLPKEDMNLPTENFSLTFMNRESDKRNIYTWLNSNMHMQIHAPGGQGKTYLLKEIRRELEADGWKTIWIDFADEAHAPYVADQYLFLQEFSRQALGPASPDIKSHELDNAMRLVGRQLANLNTIAFFLDNADRGDRRLLTWIRAEFLEQLFQWLPVRMVASCQQIIPEWQGHNIGRPFQDVPLSSFEDPGILRDIIDDSVRRFGVKRVQTRQAQYDEVWQTDLQQMSEGLFQVTRGHPLAIEQVLRFALDEDGLLHPSFFWDNRTDIYRRCLAPLVGARILPTIDKTVREAFRSICIFRYIWPGMIRALSNPHVPADLGGAWEPFSSGDRNWEIWWSLLQRTHLVYRVNERQMYPLSSVIRHIIALVLQSEDTALYQARNLRALREYERLVASPDTLLSQKVAYLLEALYHQTQAGTSPDIDRATDIRNAISNFLNTLAKSEVQIEIAHHLLYWLRADMELRGAVSQYAGPEVYEELLDSVENYIKGGQEHD